MSLDLHLKQKVAVITGGGGSICGAIAEAMAEQGAAVSIWDVSPDNGSQIVDRILGSAGSAICLQCDVTDRSSIMGATETTIERFGTIDILINGAGGSLKEATTSEEMEFFDLELTTMNTGLLLNYFGTVLCCQSVGRVFAQQNSGVILNISSIAGLTPLTRAITYSDAKAAVNSFTRWLAVHMAAHYSTAIRVNALAPGFILTDQNKFLLQDEARGCLTPRGEKILKSVPMARLGKPQEIVGAALWLVSEQASFVTGAVVPIDGGFTAFGGV
jgi:NAD(P)-dependent dehydrogenase (short-subunit alcohol dehydrogenase family)